jgi:hypothetical protein
LVDIANTPWDYGLPVEARRNGICLDANTVKSCVEVRCQPVQENLSNVLTGLILNGFAVQNANGTVGLSTGGFPYVSLSANIRNQG